MPLHVAFLAELRARGFVGDLSSNHADRTVFATDNSIYQLKPQAIAFPQTTDDLVRIARTAQDPRFADAQARPAGWRDRNQRPVAHRWPRRRRVATHEPHPRGQCRGALGPRRGRRVKDQLNAELARHGLFFAPELSTSNRATIGGMISTDACGQGSCLYGKTRDHVLELTTVLLDGTVWHSAPLDEKELAAVVAAARPGRGDSPAAR